MTLAPLSPWGGEKKLAPSAYLPIRAWQSVLTVLIFFNPEPFFELRQLLCDEFSFRSCVVTFPIQRGIEPTNVEAHHLWPPTRVSDNIRRQNPDASAKVRHAHRGARFIQNQGYGCQRLFAALDPVSPLPTKLPS